MHRIIITMGLIALGAATAAAQTPASRPLPAATAARIRVEALRARRDAERHRPSVRPSAGVRGTPAPQRLAPAERAVTPRPPKARPAG